MSRILLENMEFFAHHGYFKEEQVIGSRFIVNLELETNTTKAEQTDNLKDTVNYQEVYNTIKDQMSQKSHLLEHVGRRITDAVMERFNGILHLKVKVSKMSPPMGGKMECVSLVLETENKTRETDFER